MRFHVYLIISKIRNKYISYVGYTKDINNRILLHNSSKGAKFTKGNKWFVIYKKSYTSKSKAMKEEYKLKKNYLLRTKIKKKFISNENFNITSI